MIRSIHGLLFTIPVVLVAPLADVRLSKTLGALPPVCGITLSIVAEIAGVFNAWFWTFHKFSNSQILDKKKRATEIRLLPCNAGRGARQGYRYQFSELGYSQTLQL